MSFGVLLPFDSSSLFVFYSFSFIAVLHRRPRQVVSKTPQRDSVPSDAARSFRRETEDDFNQIDKLENLLVPGIPKQPVVVLTADPLSEGSVVLAAVVDELLLLSLDSLFKKKISLCRE